MKNGQALVMLLVFMVVAITITSAAVVIILLNSQGATKLERSLVAYQLAEGAAENALIKLLRDPSYTGETLTTSDGQATIVVSGVNPKVIVSSATVGEILRKIQVTASDSNGVLTVTNWVEVF